MENAPLIGALFGRVIKQWKAIFLAEKWHIFVVII
jgi:hypothetical protein